MRFGRQGETTWRKELQEEMRINGETWADIVSNTMTEAQMDESFDGGYGCENGCAFTVWTSRRVYFPAVHDGMEWVASVSRHPDGVPTPHIGGG